MAEATFGVPFLHPSCSLPANRRALASFWVGIGGENGVVLGQVGIVVACSSLSADGDATGSGTPSYAPFWETYCSDTANQQCQAHVYNHDHLLPGDEIHVSVTYHSSGGFGFVLTSRPPGTTTARSLVDASAPCPSGQTCKDDSVEVIAEQPENQNGSRAAYAPYGSVAFTGARWRGPRGNIRGFNDDCSFFHCSFYVDESPGAYVVPDQPSTGQESFRVAQVLAESHWTARASPGEPGDGYQWKLSCYDSRHCMAIGTELTDRVGPVASWWDGSSWSDVTPSAPPGVYNQAPNGWDLAAVSCPAANYCVAIGTALTPPRGDVVLIEAWHNGTWAQQEKPEGGADLTAISCVGPADCLAVGGGRSFFALQKAGPMWTDVSPHWSNRGNLYGVSCVLHGCTAIGADNAGTPVILHFGSNGWSRQKPADGPGTSLTGVSCTGDGCVVVGISRYTTAYSEYSTGGTWHRTRMPRAPGIGFSGLSDVDCIAGLRCWAIGDYYAANTSSALVPMVEQLDGTWHVEAVPGRGPYRALESISCTANGLCMTVGAVGQSGNKPFVLDNYGAFPG